MVGTAEIDLGGRQHDKPVERFGVKRPDLPRGVVLGCARVLEARLRGAADPAVEFPREHERGALELLRNMGSRFGVSQGGWMGPGRKCALALGLRG